MPREDKRAISDDGADVVVHVHASAADEQLGGRVVLAGLTDAHFFAELAGEVVRGRPERHERRARVQRRTEVVVPVVRAGGVADEHAVVLIRRDVRRPGDRVRGLGHVDRELHAVRGHGVAVRHHRGERRDERLVRQILAHLRQLDARLRGVPLRHLRALLQNRHVGVLLRHRRHQLAVLLLELGAELVQLARARGRRAAGGWRRRWGRRAGRRESRRAAIRVGAQSVVVASRNHRLRLSRLRHGHVHQLLLPSLVRRRLVRLLLQPHALLRLKALLRLLALERLAQPLLLDGQTPLVRRLLRLAPRLLLLLAQTLLLDLQPQRVLQLVARAVLRLELGGVHFFVPAREQRDARTGDVRRRGVRIRRARREAAHPGDPRASSGDDLRRVRVCFDAASRRAAVMGIGGRLGYVPGRSVVTRLAVRVRFVPVLVGRTTRRARDGRAASPFPPGVIGHRRARVPRVHLLLR